MGVWERMFFRMRLVFAGNGFGQTGTADQIYDLSEKNKRHTACRLHRFNKPVREVLILEN